MRKQIVLVITILLSVLQITGCAASTQPVQKTGFYLDTVISVTIYAISGNSGFNSDTADDIINGSFEVCSHYEDMFSNTISSSDISRINAAAGRPEAVSSDTVDILNTALKYSKLTDGAFDVTISPVSSLWDFKSENPVPPDSTSINEALKHVGYKNIAISGNTVTLLDDKAAIDLGGIAKGYIADRMKEYLSGQGVTSAIINLGGNVLAIGKNSDGSDFSIGIQKPFAEQNTVLTTVKVDDLSVVSSGPYERYFRYNGKLYHHILDPATGYPVDSGLNGVTIISEKSVDGDALSTSCFVLGAEKGRKLISTLDSVKAVFINSDNEVE